jgi:putative flippase GtrA
MMTPEIAPAAPLVLAPRSQARGVREFLRYFAASAVALGVDAGLFALAMRLGLGYPLAAALGFSTGVAVAYLISVYWVFEARSVHSRALEFALFVGVGALGLGLTELILWIGIGMLGLAPMVAKLVAAGGVFLFNFGVRKILLFRAVPA